MEKLYEKISILNKLSDVSEAKKDRAHKHLALVMKLSQDLWFNPNYWGD